MLQNRVSDLSRRTCRRSSMLWTGAVVQREPQEVGLVTAPVTEKVGKTRDGRLGHEDRRDAITARTGGLRAVCRMQNGRTQC